MNSSLETNLYLATALTFEELGFLIPSAELQEDQQSAALDAAVEVAFRGPSQGKLILAVAGQILPSVVSNMLGMPERAAPATEHDALGELANVICGNVLPFLSDEGEAFDLSPPHDLDLVALQTAGKSSVAQIHIGLGRGRADVYLLASGVASGSPGGMAA